MFCCPRATIRCDDANGTFFVTSVLLRSIGAEVENIESNVHLSGGKLRKFKSSFMTFITT
jgi:hypothetical protein